MPSPCTVGQSAGPVENHPQRRHVGCVDANGQPWVVMDDGARAGQDGPGSRAPELHVGPRGFGSDPFRFAVGERGPAIQAHGQLDPKPRAATLDAGKETGVQLARLHGHQSVLHRDTGRAQRREATSGNLGERVFAGCHHAGHAGSDQCIGARRRAAMMGAGLQRDVGGCAACRLPSGAQGVHFGMRLASASMKPLTEHRIVFGDHAADHRVGLAGEARAGSQAQRTGHVAVIDGRKTAHRGMMSISATVVLPSVASFRYAQPSDS
jgi:hypothetical protein